MNAYAGAGLPASVATHEGHTLMVSTLGYGPSAWCDLYVRHADARGGLFTALTPAQAEQLANALLSCVAEARARGAT